MLLGRPIQEMNGRTDFTTKIISGISNGNAILSILIAFFVFNVYPEYQLGNCPSEDLRPYLSHHEKLMARSTYSLATIFTSGTAIDNYFCENLEQQPHENATDGKHVVLRTPAEVQTKGWKWKPTRTNQVEWIHEGRTNGPTKRNRFERNPSAHHGGYTPSLVPAGPHFDEQVPRLDEGYHKRKQKQRVAIHLTSVHTFGPSWATRAKSAWRRVAQASLRALAAIQYPSIE